MGVNLDREMGTAYTGQAGPKTERRKQMKQTFVRSGDWSDYGESESGALPCAVVLPDGTRVDIDSTAIGIRQWEQGASRSRYVQMTPDGAVRVREKSYSDEPTRRSGRYRIVLEVIAPKKSTFLFARPCPWCGEKAGEQSLDGQPAWAKPDPLFCSKKCRANYEAVEAEIREQQEADRRENEAWTKRMRALGYIV